MAMNDENVVFIHGLVIEAIVGIFPVERLIRQQVIIDIEMTTCFNAIIASNSMEDGVNYQAVAERVSQVVQAEEFELLEVMADTLANTLLSEFAISDVVISCKKPQAVKHTQSVGVRIRRSSRNG